MKLTPKQRDVLALLCFGGKLRAPLCDDGPDWWLMHDGENSAFWAEPVKERTVRSLASKGLIETDTWLAQITEAGRNALADVIAA